MRAYVHMRYMRFTDWLLAPVTTATNLLTARASSAIRPLAIIIIPDALYATYISSAARRALMTLTM